MENFKTFMNKHGETGTQALLENWERFEGIRHMAPVSLEERWNMFMNKTAPAMKAAA